MLLLMYIGANGQPVPSKTHAVLGLYMLKKCLEPENPSFSEEKP